LETKDFILSSKRKKTHAIKISIKSEDFKLNLIPIPYFLAKFGLSFALRHAIKGSLKQKKDNSQFELSTKDMEELLLSTKLIISELKNYPPFVLVEVKTKDTEIYIRTL
jgi:hypothetical protein